MAIAVARLVPVHQSAAPFHQLPLERSVTIGRRATCTVVLSDGAVSGLHCVLKSLGTDPLTFQAEDRSTNGLFINEVRVTKGEHAALGHGDILALGKAVDEFAVRPRFRLEVHLQERSLELLGQPSATSRELRGDITSPEGSGGPEGLTEPTSLDNQSRLISSGTSTAEGFAQDLLLQEQRSKAKITGELLLVRRRLDEERSARESLDRELHKAKAGLEDECARRAVAQQGLQRWQAEGDQLRQDHQQLQELRREHSALEKSHETVEVELGALLQKTTTLEAGQEHLRLDLQRASSDEARVRAHLAEAHARLQQAQERTESLQKRQYDARKAAEVAQEAVERWQRELSNERGMREQLEDQATLLRADADRALDGERAAKEALAAAEAQQIELLSQCSRFREEAHALRSSTKESRDKLENDSTQAQHLRGAGGAFVEALRAYADGWARDLSDGSHLPATSRSAGQTKVTSNAKIAKSVDCVDESVLAEVAPAAVASAAKAVLTGEAVRPPVPPWEPPAVAEEVTGEVVVTANAHAQVFATPITNAGIQGQHHGMASLMVGSQDSPLVAPTRSPEVAKHLHGGYKASEKNPSQLGPDAAMEDYGAMQRLASASILSLVMPPSKRSQKLQPDSAGRKRLRAL